MRAIPVIPWPHLDLGWDGGSASRYRWNESGYRSPFRNSLPMGGQVRDAVFLVGHDRMTIQKGPNSAGPNIQMFTYDQELRWRFLDPQAPWNEVGGDGVGPLNLIDLESIGSATPVPVNP